MEREFEMNSLDVVSDDSVKIVDMHGPYAYTAEEVKKRVFPGLDGNYRTGVLNKKGLFVPKYVGRGCVYTRLLNHLDEGFADTHFKFVYVDDEVESYRIESSDYHRFASQLRNDIHPRKPDGETDETCPCCGQ